jgi:hypothetical protein
MNGNPSKYGGPAAVIVFGTGLLIVGNILEGLAVLGAGILVLAVVWAPTIASSTFFLALGALVCSGVFAYRAVSNEISGTAEYLPGIRGKSITVTRADSPAKFRQLTNENWGIGGCCLIVGGLGLIYCRKLDDCV